MELEILMFVVRQRRHHVRTLPYLVGPVTTRGVTLSDETLLERGIGDN